MTDHDRVIVELEPSRADGTARKARAWVDTGQVGLGLTAAVAKDLALAPGAATPSLRLLSTPEMANAEKPFKEWSTPRRLLKRLRGERHDVFEEVNQFW